MFALVVQFDVLSDHVDAFDTLVAKTLAEITAREPETVVYVTHTNLDHPNERIFYECYKDERAFATHETNVHTRHFLAERGQHLAGDPQVWRLGDVDGVIGGRAFDDGSITE